MKAKFEKALWYLKVLRNNYSVFQPEIREAVDVVIEFFENVYGEEEEVEELK